MSAMAGDCWGGYGYGFGTVDLLRWLKQQARAMEMSGRRSRGPFGGKRFGQPWAPWWDWAGEGPGRPRAAKGDVRLAVLALLTDGPRHGYQLIQDIGERSHGMWTPSPGSVYPTLSALQDEGLIDDEKSDGKRVFSLTDEGRGYVAAHDEEIHAVFDGFSADDTADMADVRSLMVGVAAASMQVIASGRVADAQRILSRARRDLFAVLAQDEEQ